MSIETPPLKKMPRGPRKGEVLAMFPDQPERDLRHEMNCLIRKHRGIPEGTRVYEKFFRQ